MRGAVLIVLCAFLSSSAVYANDEVVEVVRNNQGNEATEEFMAVVRKKRGQEDAIREFVTFVRDNENPGKDKEFLTLVGGKGYDGIKEEDEELRQDNTGQFDTSEIEENQKYVAFVKNNQRFVVEVKETGYDASKVFSGEDGTR